MLRLAADLSFSVFATDWYFFGHMLTFSLSALLAFALCLLLVRGLFEGGRALPFLLFDGMFFALCIVLDTVLRITFPFPFSIFPMRETNAADGLLLMMGCALFTAASLIMRLCLVFVKLPKRNAQP